MNVNGDKKPVENFVNEHDETKQINRVAGYAFLLNLLLSIMKALLAFFSGSLAITASAIDSGTDAIASLVIYGGVRLSTRKTKTFPLGLHKLENIASVVIALFIFIAGFEIIREVFSPVESVPHISVIYIILLLSGTVAIFFFGQYAMSVGRKTGSPTLIAEGRHRQVDFLASVVVLFSVILSYFDFKADIMGITVDQIGAALILVFIAHAGWGLLSDGMRVLLDASLDFDTLDRVREIIRSDPMVDEIKGLVGRNAGRFRFIQAEITLKTRDLEKAHQISNSIEKKIREEISRLEKVTIHYEPKKREFERLALPLENPEGRLSKHFGEAPYFGILEIGLQNREAVTKKILTNPHRSVETAKGIRVAEWLVEQGVEHVGLKEDVSKKGPGYVLSNGGVKLHIISAEELDQAIDEIFVQASMTSPDPA